MDGSLSVPLSSVIALALENFDRCWEDVMLVDVEAFVQACTASLVSDFFACSCL